PDESANAALFLKFVHVSPHLDCLLSQEWRNDHTLVCSGDCGQMVDALYVVGRQLSFVECLKPCLDGNIADALGTFVDAYGQQLAIDHDDLLFVARGKQTSHVADGQPCAFERTE